jgi:hypothetical protein
LTVNSILHTGISPVISKLSWPFRTEIEPLLRGHLSYKATFPLSQGWPLNTGWPASLLFSMKVEHIVFHWITDCQLEDMVPAWIWKACMHFNVNKFHHLHIFGGLTVNSILHTGISPVISKLSWPFRTEAVGLRWYFLRLHYLI